MRVKFECAEFQSYFDSKKGAFVYGCLTLPHDKKAAQKVVVRPVLQKGAISLLLEFHEKTRSITKHGSFEPLLSQYKELFLRFQYEEFQLQITPDSLHGQKRALLEKAPIQLAHNRKKSHILQEGESIAFLQELGLTSKTGAVLAHAQHKFRQINRFLEMVKDIDYFPTRIADLGCGKAYLTFALYHYYQHIIGHTVEVVGVDLRDDVLNHCNAIAKKLGMTGLSFQKGTIQDFIPEQAPDMVVALHACNTASDHAIDQAIHWKSKAIFIAPCCQHELYQKMKKEEFPERIKYPLLQERYAALETDARRGEKLEKAGYKVQMLEFIDPEHTPKNLLIRAVSR